MQQVICFAQVLTWSAYGFYPQSSRRKLKIQYFIAFFLYCFNVYLKTKLTVSYTAMPLSELCHRFNIIHRFLLR